MKVLVLIEWKLKPGGWSLLNALKKSNHDFYVIEKEVCRNYGNKLLRLYHLFVGYFYTGFKAFQLRNDVDVIVSWQGIAALLYGLLLKIFHVNGASVIVMGFFIREHDNHMNAWILKKLVRLTIRHFKYIVCYSSFEVAKYQNMFPDYSNIFVFIPLGVNTLRQDFILSQSSPRKNYILSVGSSNRDYKTFFRAVESLDVQAVVIAKKYNISGLEIPENVTVYYDIYGEEYNKLFWESRFVVVSLADLEVSSGQMVMLDAMFYNKAIIITRTHTTEDYIKHNQTGLLIAPKNAEDMQSKINTLLSHPEITTKLTQNAKAMVMDKFSMIRMAKNLIHLIEEK